MSVPYLRSRYRAAFSAMSPCARRVFWMHRIQDCSIVEIAERLAIPHGRVEDLLAAAIVHIDRALRAPYASAETPGSAQDAPPPAE